MRHKSILPLSATILPGATARVIAKPRAAFRLERLLVSPYSFPLSLGRRAWTWPLVTIGNVLGRVHRGLAKLLGVHPYAAHERREYVSEEYAQMHAEEVSWESRDEEDEGRPFVLVPTPLNRRERLLAPLGRAARRLSLLRLSWQQAQLATLLVCNITISKQPQFVEGAGPLPADLFDPLASDTSMNFSASSCMAGHEIEIDVHNGNSRECQLVMSLIGSSLGGLDPLAP